MLRGLLGGSWDLVTTYGWAHKPAHHWDELNNQFGRLQVRLYKPSYEYFLSPMSLKAGPAADAAAPQRAASGGEAAGACSWTGSPTPKVPKLLAHILCTVSLQATILGTLEVQVVQVVLRLVFCLSCQVCSLKREFSCCEVFQHFAC